MENLISQFKYDLFISFSSEDKIEAQEIEQKLISVGLKVFISTSNESMLPGTQFVDTLFESVDNSRNFLLLCTNNIVKSKFVDWECSRFFTRMTSEKSIRKIYIFEGKGFREDCVPKLLYGLERSNTIDSIIKDIFTSKLRFLEDSNISLAMKCGLLEKKISENQKHYLYSKFWDPIVFENREIHLITCGRNAVPSSYRGSGARTTIDKWDFISVQDLTHFLLKKYPKLNPIIDSPRSKIDISDNIISATQQVLLTQQITNKDCLIIGSPDVSDFAEIVLAHVHNLEPYSKKRVKKHGFVIIKANTNNPSSFYWEKMENEKEGVVKIEPNGDIIEYPTTTANNDGNIIEMYGIIVLVKNPFVTNKKKCHIIILSGFSGISTYSLVNFLTDDKYELQFNKFDDAFQNRNKNIEILVKVQFYKDKNTLELDNRKICDGPNAIEFVDLVEI